MFDGWVRFISVEDKRVSDLWGQLIIRESMRNLHLSRHFGNLRGGSVLG